MLRFLFDPLGDWHDDLVLKIDGLPGMTQVVDSHFLGGFLDYAEEGGADNVRRDIVLSYVDFVTEQITSINGKERFIPVDLSDQYVGGLLVRTSRKGLLNMKYVWTDSLAGYEVHRKRDFAGIAWKQEREFELSKEAVLDGLKWSKDTISGKQ